MKVHEWRGGRSLYRHCADCGAAEGPGLLRQEGACVPKIENFYPRESHPEFVSIYGRHVYRYGERIFKKCMLCGLPWDEWCNLNYPKCEKSYYFK